ncbi:MAG TPA: sigma-70 family RNA polymerase sigma factor [Terriglobales bacterium]|nr:sigma-70 family RNA polymerase sigma factor [Terriglobales bacterium]
MEHSEWLAQQFEQNRGHLRAVAYRMLGSASEADDAIQESWLRLSRSNADAIENLGGWLTTVIAHICLDMLRTRASRREEELPARETPNAEEMNAEQEMVIANSIGAALQVVLDSLAPAERVAFVLHDMFDIPFETIATIVDRTPAATRQLASRARRRVQAGSDRQGTARVQQQVVEAFRAAARDGDFEGLLRVLAPNVVLRCDRAAVELSTARRNQGAPVLEPEVRGAAAVAETFKGRAAAAQPVLIDGVAGLMWAPGGRPMAVFRFRHEGGRVAAIDLIADANTISGLNLEQLA